MSLLEKFDAVVVQADNRISETISVYANTPGSLFYTQKE